jgi:hypothetical protein
MTIRTRRFAAVLSTAALLGGTGFGVAEAAKSSNGSQATQSARAGGKHGGPIPSAAIAKIATALGVTAADLKTALEANKPAKPSAEGPQGGPGDRAADLATALGVETAAVQDIMEANRPARPASKPARGSKPAKPGHSRLIAALATGLGIDEATVTAAVATLEAAHEAEHEARHTAMYAALATALGKTADEVQAAFEANRPAKPTA